MSEATSHPGSASTSSALSVNGSLTGSGNGAAEPSGSSQTAPTNGSSPASPPSTIDPMALTTASWITLTKVAYPMSLGYSEREVARELGVPKKQVDQRLEALREELMEQ